MHLFTTPTQFAALALMLVAGWFLGLASHPGGKKWRARYAAERDAHAATRKDAEVGIAAATARTAELERERAPLATPVVVTTAPAQPTYTIHDGKGWFDWPRH